jgi:hypothetical protein
VWTDYRLVVVAAVAAAAAAAVEEEEAEASGQLQRRQVDGKISRFGATVGD